MAALPKSPSITIIEQNKSTYTVTSAATVVAYVGFASYGPINTVVSTNSKSNFLFTFGTPSSSSPYSAMSVLRTFNQTNQVLFYRVGNTLGDSLTRLAYAERVVTSAGDSNKVLFQAENYGSYVNGAYFTFTQRADPISGDSKWDFRFYTSDNTLQETYSNVSWKVGDSRFFATIIGATVDNGGSAWLNVTVKQWGAKPYVKLAPIGSLAGSVTTYYIGQPQSGDTRRAASISNGDTYSAKVGDTKWYTFRIGRDGIVSGSAGGDTLFSNALATTASLANKELWNYHVLACPDNNDSIVTDAGIALAENRQDFLFIVDPPFGKSVANIVNWHNGTGGQGRSTPLNSSYAATWWPWLKDFNAYSAQYIWCPPSVFIPELLCKVDASFGAWYAPAGDNRGKILAYNYEQSPSLADRDNLYGDLNAVNPIVNFAVKGLEAYGQKTLLRQTSAINRLNVRRMVIYIKKLIKNAMDGIVFEPHNADSWARATTIINSILEPVRQANGLADYKVQIDSTTNTPSLIAQSIMSGIIQIVPVGTIEIIQLTIQINAVGSTIT